MYDFLNRSRGSAVVTVTGAMPVSLINRCASGGVEILSAVPVDDFTICMRIPYSQLSRLRELAEKSMCEIREGVPGGAAGAARKLRRRLIPVILMALLVTVLLASKLFIWEINVSGNKTVPTGKILDVLSRTGVDIGSCWVNMTSDSVRSMALSCIPELSWLTVNIYGSRAEVIVRERIKAPELLDEDVPADVIADRDGFITNVRALIGKESVKAGQAVTKGETLISGAVESKNGKIRTVHAYGEVTARTFYELSAITPRYDEVKSYTGQSSALWALQIGGKRINFYGNSSIYYTGCDKIYTEYKLEKKGLFSLPVSLIRIECTFYETLESPTDEMAAEMLLAEALTQRLPGEDRGSVIEQSSVGTASESAISVCVRAECEEKIGKTEIIDAGRLEEIARANEISTEEGNS